LLQGETVTLTELADWIYGESTPGTVWQAWLVLHAQIYFVGSIEQINTRTKAEVEEIFAKQREKEQQAVDWQNYLQRVRDNAIQPEDISPLKEVERMAYGKASTNRTLKDLGIGLLPEKAHKLLLQLGLWNDTVNPYPLRFDCAITQPELEVPALPDEPREDLTALETFAIDDDACSDPDDAISLDGDSLWIHVADAAALIKADSPLDLEARARGANLYLPEIVINMLPEAVTQALGLGLEEISPALSFKIGFDAEGIANQFLETFMAESFPEMLVNFSYSDEMKEQFTVEAMETIHKQIVKAYGSFEGTYGLKTNEQAQYYIVSIGGNHVDKDLVYTLSSTMMVRLLVSTIKKYLLLKITSTLK